MRLFVAADLPPAVRRRLAERGQALEAGGGWRGLGPATIHVTLAFLGEHPETDVEPIAAVLPPAWEPVDGLGLGKEVRLPARQPLAWAVEILDPLGALAALQARVAAGLSAAGLHVPERRAFLPHATVARRRGGPAGTPPPPAWDMGSFGIVHLTLYASRLSPRGAAYDVLARLPA